MKCVNHVNPLHSRVIARHEAIPDGHICSVSRGLPRCARNDVIFLISLFS